MTKKQILIVEDNHIEANDIRQTLKCLGYTVSEFASSGADAIRKVEKTLPDLVLMDIKLKGKMNGIKAAEQIRGRFDIPVIYLTAYTDEDILRQAKITKPFGYILKPFMVRELHANIEIALYKHKLEKTLRERAMRYREDLEKQVEERTAELKQTNEQLRQEIIERKQTEEQLQKYQEHIEDVVNERTTELKNEITERKQVEEVLRESEERFRTIFDNAAEGIAVVDKDGLILDVNAANCRFLGYSRAELVGTHFTEFIAPQDVDVAMSLFHSLVKGERNAYKLDKRFVRKGGHIVWGHVSVALVINADGCPQYTVIVCEDVTRRKRTEEQIRASLKEKEVLLQEIHHRVKNNLQVISSLLDMSTLRTQDQQAIDLLTNARARIHIMALIHTQLYQSERFEQINMEYHLRELIKYLSAVYAERKIVTPHVEASGVYLSLIQAIPCALILNELITNAFKHAFKEGQAGTLDINMQQLPENTIVLRVKDNGIGIRDDIDLEHTNTLGLKLVRILVQQLRGEIQIERNGGSEYMITFDI